MQFYSVIHILLVTVVMKVLCDCGVITPRESSPTSLRDLIFGSGDESFPWHVTIIKTFDPNTCYEVLCAGTLISPDVVITTAATFHRNPDWRISNASALMVIAIPNNHLYSWPDSSLPQSRVKTINVASGWNGSNIKYKNIAWLILENPFDITPFVNPGMKDELVGFFPPKYIYERLELSVFSHIDCYSKLVDKKMWANLTTGTFCAARDSYIWLRFGTGFFVQREGRWYLSAVHTGIIRHTETAGNYYLIVLTSVRDYIDEIYRNSDIGRLNVADFPGTLLSMKKNSTGTYDQICSGSMISSNIVVSAAHCFYDSTRRQKLDASNFAVAAGKQYRPYYWPERFFQTSAIKTIHIPDRYYGLDGLYAEDIAWLILERQFNVSMFVRPICIDFNNSHEREDLQSGRSGKAAGWGVTANGSASLELQEMNVPFVPYEDCVSTFPRDAVPFLTSDKFCGGYSNGTSLCKGDSGGGLAFKRKGRWFLRGIVSSSPQSGGTCHGHSYTVFTNVGRFMDELYRFTNLTAHDLI